jgi:hypothetical protein
LLARERQMAAYTLAYEAQRKDPSFGALEHADDPSIKNPAYMEPAQQRLLQLLNDLQLIGDAAAHGWDYYPVQPELPRVRNFEQKEEIFCIRLLLRAAKVAFDKPLIQEVGETIAVLFDKEQDQRSRVQSIWNSMQANQEYPVNPM